nr:retrovirus-related Pol polyprotein from transposon TNT 1-94 [Tanacetum cinerariifolium]
ISDDVGSPPFGDARKKHDEVSDKGSGASNELNSAFENLNTEYPDDPKMLGLDTIETYDDSEEEANFTNFESSIHVSPTPTTRIHKNHPLNAVYEGKTHEDLNTCFFACFLTQIEPTRVAKALSTPSWVEAMQEELLQFKLQKVWILVDLPKGKKATDTKWVLRNKKDERGIMIKNKASLVTQGYTQEEGIHYDEVFAHVARIKAIRLSLAYASFMGFMVYQMDVKSALVYGKIKEEVYVYQPLGFEDLNHPYKVYKVVKSLYGLHQALRAWRYFDVQVYVDDIIFGSTKKELCVEFERLMNDKFQMSSMGELTFFLGLQMKQKEDGIFISQDKYVDEVLRKFNFLDVESAGTLMDTEKTLVKDADGDDVDVHL